MTGGDKAGGGSKARGQPADMLIFDEVDYISPKDIEAAIAILADNPSCKIIASSTPTGKREFLYEICTNKARRYKEFFMASHASPAYTKIADDEVREASSSSAYRREMLAEFGEETTGVFAQRDIDLSKKVYYLENERRKGPLPGWIYMVGVDWNGRAIGTHIVVVGFNKATNRYRLVDKIVVANEAFTQTKACQTIINSYKYWSASHIYVDFGAGEVQGELINRHAVQTGDKALAEAFKPIAMHGNIEVKNPASGLPEKKNNQQLAIDLLSHRLEHGLVDLPASEEYKGGSAEEMGLITQMRHFQIEKISASGKPKYAGVDHTLTAFYLTFLAFQVEKSTLGQVKYDNTVIVRGSGSMSDGPTVQGVMEAQKDKRKMEGIAPGVMLPRTSQMDNTPPSMGMKSFEGYRTLEGGIKGRIAVKGDKARAAFTSFIHNRKSF
jgi:replicative DNA helicase